MLYNVPVCAPFHRWYWSYFIEIMTSNANVEVNQSLELKATCRFNDIRWNIFRLNSKKKQHFIQCNAFIPTGVRQIYFNKHWIYIIWFFPANTSDRNVVAKIVKLNSSVFNERGTGFEFGFCEITIFFLEWFRLNEPIKWNPFYTKLSQKCDFIHIFRVSINQYRHIYTGCSLGSGSMSKWHHFWNSLTSSDEMGRALVN